MALDRPGRVRVGLIIHQHPRAALDKAAVDHALQKLRAVLGLPAIGERPFAVQLPGGQTSVTVIRNLALGEIELRDWPHVLAKEIGVAIVSGAALALVNFLRIIIFTSTSMMIAAVVSVTLFCTVIIAMIVGCLLPIGAKKLGFDPAVMASPMITTIVDACSLMIYFLIATSMLGL